MGFGRYFDGRKFGKTCVPNPDYGKKAIVDVMSRAHLIYPLHRLIEKQLSLINKDPYNKEILTRYYKVRSIKIEPASLLLVFRQLNFLSRILNKKFEEATVKDIEDLVFEISQRYPNLNTQNIFLRILRIFYKWLRGCSKYEYPPEVKWIELNKVPDSAVKPNDLLSFDECVRISEFAKYLRDKAWIQAMLNSGCRIGEILPATIGDVEFNEKGAFIESDGKTGEWPVILTWSAKTLTSWLNIHPFRNDKDAPLWPVMHRDKPKQLSYAGARHAFVKCVKEAGYTRRVWHHLFRHVSVNEDSKNGMSEPLIKYKHHLKPNSTMLKTYQHLSRSIVPQIQNQQWKLLNGSEKGTKEPAVEKQPLELLKKCMRCNEENPRDSMFCNRCAYPLDEKKAAEMMYEKISGKKTDVDDKLDALRKKFENSPEALDKLLKALDLFDNKKFGGV